MLVLSRRANQELIIGHDAEIVVMIVDVRDGKVRMGITAPSDVPVHRREVYESIQREKLAKLLQKGISPMPTFPFTGDTPYLEAAIEAAGLPATVGPGDLRNGRAFSQIAQRVANASQMPHYGDQVLAMAEVPLFLDQMRAALIAAETMVASAMALIEPKLPPPVEPERQVDPGMEPT